MKLFKKINIKIKKINCLLFTLFSCQDDFCSRGRTVRGILRHVTTTIDDMGRRAKVATRSLARLSTDDKNGLLRALAEALESAEAQILSANEADLARARESGTSGALLDRLSLAGGRLKSIAADVRAVAQLPDPVGEVFDEKILPGGIAVHKKRVPLGVLGVIYEARPNVTVDIAALALKTGNAAILRGGSETLQTNTAIIRAIAPALPEDAIQLIESTDRALVTQLLKLHKYVDMIIPRGGADLHEFCRENSTIPVIIGGIGVCHLFVDESVDQKKALDVIENAKCQRPAVCNALDTLLIHRSIADEFLPKVRLVLGERGVKFVDNEFDTEWMSLTLGIKVVEGLDEALVHIHTHSSGHSDGILTENAENAARFLREVDSAAVFHNVSTRFNDGGQLGLGAEVAVSTQKLHARGPMGLDALTTYKWIVTGDYATRL
jgi:glutamate-5-semialdehyde dehydrogenase